MRKLLAVSGILIVIITGYALSLKSYPITNADTSGRVILCFGASLTYGTGATKGMSYPEQLSRMIGRPVINAGIPGNTTQDALARLDRDVLAHRPDIVLVTLGGNDLLKGIPKDRTSLPRL